MRVRILLSVGLVVLMAACERAENLHVVVGDHVTKAQGEPIEYVYAEDAAGRTVEVKGRIEDSIRHSETMLVDGAPVLDRVVHDDALALHALLPDQVPQLASPQPADLAVAEALRRGQWVIDPAGAPAEGSAGQATQAVGADPLTDAATVFQYTRLALSQAARVVRFNPDAIDYLPEEDPFPHPDKAGGEERFDLVPPPLPRAEGETLPGPASFRKMSIYVSKNRVSRIFEQIDIDGQREIKRARQTGRNKFLLRLADDVKRARGGQEIRERKMTFTITSRTPVEVALPPDGTAGNLRVLFGQATP